MFRDKQSPGTLYSPIALWLARARRNAARSKPNPPQAAHTDADAQRTGMYLHLLRSSPVPLNLQLATINSWEHDAPVDFSLLKGAMTVWMGEPSQEPYARSLAMVQSSGTGKSRMNDEMAKKIVYVPMVLAEHDNGECPFERPLARV